MSGRGRDSDWHADRTAGRNAGRNGLFQAKTRSFITACEQRHGKMYIIIIIIVIMLSSWLHDSTSFQDFIQMEFWEAVSWILILRWQSLACKKSHHDKCHALLLTILHITFVIVAVRRTESFVPKSKCCNVVRIRNKPLVIRNGQAFFSGDDGVERMFFTSYHGDIS